jgi:hypothetical protein
MAISGGRFSSKSLPRMPLESRHFAPHLALTLSFRNVQASLVHCRRIFW